MTEEIYVCENGLDVTCIEHFRTSALRFRGEIRLFCGTMTSNYQRLAVESAFDRLPQRSALVAKTCGQRGIAQVLLVSRTSEVAFARSYQWPPVNNPTETFGAIKPYSLVLTVRYTVRSGRHLKPAR